MHHASSRGLNEISIFTFAIVHSRHRRGILVRLQRLHLRHHVAASENSCGYDLRTFDHEIPKV